MIYVRLKELFFLRKKVEDSTLYLHFRVFLMYRCDATSVAKLRESENKEIYKFTKACSLSCFIDWTCVPRSWFHLVQSVPRLPIVPGRLLFDGIELWLLLFADWIPGCSSLSIDSGNTPQRILAMFCSSRVLWFVWTLLWRLPLTPAAVVVACSKSNRHFDNVWRCGALSPAKING